MDEYAIVGKRFAKVRQPEGGKKRVEKKYHIIRGGASLCSTENGYKGTPPYTFAEENPEQYRVCKICIQLADESIYAEPRLAVVMGERIAE